jgi:hypothetical protein
MEEGGAVIPYDLFNAEFGDDCWLSSDPAGNEYCSIAPSTGSCVPQTFSSVPLQPELVGDDEGLALIVHVSPDGGRVALGGLYDLEREVALYVVGAEGATTGRLLPLGGGPLTWYGSAPIDCSELPQPLPRDFVEIDGCYVRDDTRFVTEAETSVSNPPVHRTFSTEPADVIAHWCFASEGGPMPISEPKHALRATEVSIDEWNRGTRVRTGTGRYRYDAWQVGCRLITSRPETLYDTQRDDEACSFLDDGSGTARCLPTYRDIAMVAYTDPACTDRVAIKEDPPEPMKRYAQENAPLDGDRSLYEVGAELATGTAVYYHDSEPCISYHQGVGVSVYELGRVVPPEEFGLLRVEVQP